MKLVPLLLSALLAGCTAPDSGDSQKTGATDADGDGYTTDDDCDDTNADINPGAAESCDGVDNDCDSDIDEDGASGATTWYADADSDGFGSTDTTTACSMPQGYAADGGDCDDSSASVNPNATETCDGVDNDCDGDTDEAGATGSSTFYADLDGDTYGDPGNSTDACSAPSGYVSDSGDCDDGAAGIHPGAPELCDGIDNDCDTLADDADADVSDTTTGYLDDDADGFGLDDVMVSACALPSGYAAMGGDCDDADADVNPAATEVCDGIDDDCDGAVDDEDADVADASTWYADVDGDTYGDATSTMESCEGGDGWTMDASDCDDTDASINPGASEVCDGVDNDCDALVDDADDSVSGGTTWYVDNDGDGAGDPSMTVVSCTQPSGYVDVGGDPYEDGSVSVLSATGDLQETVDVASNGAALYAVGFNASGDATVVSVDMGTGAVTALFTGYPLVQPSGLALSADGSTLYVADVAATGSDPGFNGGVYEVPTSGGSATEIGAMGTIDLPGDVAVSGTDLWVSGMDGAGDPALFKLAGGGAPTEMVTGGSLVDPLALAVSPDGLTVYVVDPLAGDGVGEVLAYGTDGSALGVQIDQLDVAFPGGAAVDDSGEHVFVTAASPGDLLAFATDLSTLDSLDTTGLLHAPTGLAASGSSVWVGDASASSSADLFLFSY